MAGRVHCQHPVPSAGSVTTVPAESGPCSAAPQRARPGWQVTASAYRYDSLSATVAVLAVGREHLVGRGRDYNLQLGSDVVKPCSASESSDDSVMSYDHHVLNSARAEPPRVGVELVGARRPTRLLLLSISGKCASFSHSSAGRIRDHTCPIGVHDCEKSRFGRLCFSPCMIH